MEGLDFEQPYIDPELQCLFERVYPPSVCIDNNVCKDCTVVKIDSANKHGILLEMVQVLTDLNLVISKSYICSDGGWFMDVFHVTDQSGNKVTDEIITQCIKEGLCATRRKPKEALQNCPGSDVRPLHLSSKNTAVEITVVDRPGLLSEVSATLAELGCHITAAVAWTHNAHAACIFYVEEKCKMGPITDMAYLARIQEQLEIVVVAHHQPGEKVSVRLITPVTGKIHTERRLHQLMLEDEDYEMCYGGSCNEGNGGGTRLHGKSCLCTIVETEYCKEKGYSVVNIRSRDRPRLLFDTVCVLTDMNYEVFHAAMSSRHSIAFQEYYIRNKDGWTMNTEADRNRVELCLVAAVERRTSHGLKVDISAINRTGLLSDVSRVLRESGLSVSRAEVGMQGEKAVGTFYVKDASGHDEICPETVKEVLKPINGIVQVLTNFLGFPTQPSHPPIRSAKSDVLMKPKLFSIGNLVWSRLESFSSNFSPIKL